MKTYLLLFFFLVTSAIYAQPGFIQPQAEWHYDATHGSMRQYVYADTVFHSKDCKVIRHQVFIDSLLLSRGFWLSKPADLYIYSSSDTVFVYNVLFGRFTPLYVFNVKPGDTVRLPVLPTLMGKSTNPIGDSTFCIVIDSVKTERVDTAYLKTVYSTPIHSTVKQELEYGKYTWRIGTPRGLLPQCVYDCAFLLSDNIGFDGPIRCYQDNTIMTKYVQGDCNRGLPLGIQQEPSLENEITIYPNPANNILSIKTSSLHVEKMQLVNVTGQVILDKAYPSQDIQVDTIPGGLYYIRLFVNESILIRKIVIQH